MSEAWEEGPEEPLSEAAAEAYVASTCFKTGPPGLLGLELEFVVVHDRDWTTTVDHDRVLKILESVPVLPAGGALTLEPGGQVELSTRTAPDLDSLLVDAHLDLTELRAAFCAEGIELVGTGLDPVRSPRRVLQQPRYVAMERSFARWGTHGRTMMCSTAAVQLTVDAGTDSESAAYGYAARWDLLHAIGPTLVAAFANSPLREGRPTGWKSARQQAWLGFDRSRTAPVHRPVVGTRASGQDLRAAYADYALDAGLLLLRGNGPDWRAPEGLSFRDWVRGAWRSVEGLRAPVRSDLDYHLTTLFPPVRARGPVEVRYIDAQPGDRWRVPAAVVTALLDDPIAGEQARAAVEPVIDSWTVAARCGLGDPALGQAAVECLSAASDGLRRLGAAADVVSDVDSYLECFTSRGLAPADQQLLDVDVRESQAC